MGVACSCERFEESTTELLPRDDSVTPVKDLAVSPTSPGLSELSTKAACDESQAVSASFHLEKVETDKDLTILETDEATDASETLADIRRAIKAQDFSAARDISKPTAKVLFLHTTPPPRDLVQFGINSKEQVSTIPLLEVKDKRIECGTIPTIWALPHWPMWFPFYKLHTSEECLEILMRSPPPGSEGQEWMGITVPPKCGSLPRISIKDSCLRLRPTAMDHFRCDLQMEIEDQAGAPQWVKVFIFQQLAIRIIPELCKFQSKIRGSALDDYLNRRGAEAGVEVIDQEGLDYIFEMQQSIEKYVKGQNGDGRPLVELPSHSVQHSAVEAMMVKIK